MCDRSHIKKSKSVTYEISQFAMDEAPTNPHYGVLEYCQVCDKPHPARCIVMIEPSDSRPEMYPICDECYRMEDDEAEDPHDVLMKRRRRGELSEILGMDNRLARILSGLKQPK